MADNQDSAATWTQEDRAIVALALHRYESSLLRYAASLVGPAAAADVVQDSFLALCRNEPRKLGEHLVAWLFVVCKNRALELLREARRHRPLGVAEELPAERLSEHDSEPLESSDPFRHSDARHSMKRIEGLLSQLPEKHRQVIILKFGAGLSYKEIAEVMSLSVSHVGVILHTALGRLRQHMADPIPLQVVRSSA